MVDVPAWRTTEPRRPERVTARRGRELPGRGAPLDHRQHDRPVDCPGPSAAAPPGPSSPTARRLSSTPTSRHAGSRSRRPRSREGYDAFLHRLVHAAGIATPTRAELTRLDRKRAKKGSNDGWTHPQDPDAKDGRTHLAHKAEHAVALETGAVVGVTVQDAHADGGGIARNRRGRQPADSRRRRWPWPLPEPVVRRAASDALGPVAFMRRPGTTPFATERPRLKRVTPTPAQERL